MLEIVVIGAGVLGLSAATLLQWRYPGAVITIIAHEFPTRSPAAQDWTNGDAASVDYASMWAGAHYRPIPGSSDQLRHERELAFVTNRHMRKIAREHRKDSGVQIVPAAEYLEEPPPEYTHLTSGDAYADHRDGFRVLSGHEIEKLNETTVAKNDQSKIKWGCEYETYVVNVHRYCAWLLQRFQKGGGRIVKARLSDVSEAFESRFWNSTRSPRVVINCSGRNFDKDPKMKIIRGQTVLVRQQYDATRTRQNKDGSWSFLIPRPEGGGTIVGGTKEIGDETDVARAETRKALLANAARSFPDFVKHVEDFDVICDNVGRRPWREGGVRVEAEQLPTGMVIHGYGAGGRGYELSWGIAERICELIGGNSSMEAMKPNL